jgi:hypothetical protein
LIVRSTVDLPLPEGPISAVTSRFAAVTLMFRTAWKDPYQQPTSLSSTAISVASMTPTGAADGASSAT